MAKFYNMDELKEFFKNLGEVEGYIQMSDEEINTFKERKSIDYDEIKDNFIFEAMFFDGDRSVLIRQFNDKYLVIDEKLSEFTETSTDVYFVNKNKNYKAKITTIWIEEEDSECLNLKVLKPKLQLFSGFVKDEK